jgi:hypothetical protein
MSLKDKIEAYCKKRAEERAKKEKKESEKDQEEVRGN